MYGSSYEEHKLEFINELHNLLASWSATTLVGGDFNLVRSSHDKSKGNIDQRWANKFNAWIELWSLIEI